jgi:hypothetical protein
MKHKSKCGKCQKFDYRYGEGKRWCLVYNCYCYKVCRKCKEGPVSALEGK